MKKLFLTMFFSMFLFATANAGSYGIGVSGTIANISASGTGINGTGSFHHATVNGNVTSSGTASFEGGFFSTNGTGSLAYATISGDMDIAGHISGSRISASAGLEVDHTGSFRYISSPIEIS